MGRPIDEDLAINAIQSLWNNAPSAQHVSAMFDCEDAIRALPSMQLEYEELTPEEAASELASESTMSAWYWLDDMVRLKQMGYAICRKR